MPKEEWGTKRLCPATGKRFYDMNRTPVVSPYTGEEVEVDRFRTRMIAADDEDAATAKSKALADGDDQVLDDDPLEEEGEDNVSLDELADVASEEDES